MVSKYALKLRTVGLTSRTCQATDGDGWMAQGPDVTFRAVAKFVPAAATAAGLKNISRGSFARPFSSVGPAPNKAEERRD